MAKTPIDAEVDNEIFRVDWSAIIAKRRDLASIAPIRLAYQSGGYLAGQLVARVTSTGIFNKFATVSGGTYDTPCVLFENIRGSDMDSTLTGGSLARAIMAGYVYKAKLLQYDSTAKTAMGAVEQTDADGITVVKF